VRKVAREGNSAVSVLFAGVSFRSRTLVLADGILFFGDLDNGGVLRKGPAAGGDDATHVTGQPAVQHLVAAESRLWWASFDGGTSALRRAPVAASTPVEPSRARAAGWLSTGSTATRARGPRAASGAAPKGSPT
jgi:hypothetical protein